MNLNEFYVLVKNGIIDIDDLNINQSEAMSIDGVTEYFYFGKDYEKIIDSIDTLQVKEIIIKNNRECEEIITYKRFAYDKSDWLALLQEKENVTDKYAYDWLIEQKDNKEMPCYKSTKKVPPLFIDGEFIEF